jgi:hypothetical protein
LIFQIIQQKEDNQASNRKSDSEVRRDIVERRDDQLRTERGPPNTIDRDQFNNGKEEQQVTPESL